MMQLLHRELSAMGENTAPVVSVVMPCLNEASGVAVCVEKALRAMAAMGVEGEVVVADNGSPDGSPELAERAGARVVRESRRGYGSAYLRGLSEARGKFLVMGDADDTYDFLDIARFVAPLASGEADLVMGTRLKGKILPGAMPWTHRWIGNPILSGMLKLLFRTSISDSHCGMRSFTREAWQRMALRTTGMEFASEMVVSALRNGLRVAEIPITYRPRIGESKLAGVRDAWRHVRFMLLYSPSYLFQLPGLLLIAIGGFLMAALAGGPREAFGRMWDYHPLLFGALAFILGYNLVLFDVLAKTFSMGAGFATPKGWLKRLSRGFSLERGMFLGGVLLAVGLGVLIDLVYDWYRSGGGPLLAVRAFMLGTVAVVVGAQTIFGSFLIGLMTVPRREGQEP
jgi:glycosyltransferase involved in cell wall biosynthesis